MNLDVLTKRNQLEQADFNGFMFHPFSGIPLPSKFTSATGRTADVIGRGDNLPEGEVANIKPAWMFLGPTSFSRSGVHIHSIEVGAEKHLQ